MILLPPYNPCKMSFPFDANSGIITYGSTTAVGSGAGNGSGGAVQAARARRATLARYVAGLPTLPPAAAGGRFVLAVVTAVMVAVMDMPHIALCIFTKTAFLARRLSP